MNQKFLLSVLLIIILIVIRIFSWQFFRKDNYEEVEPPEGMIKYNNSQLVLSINVLIKVSGFYGSFD